MSRRAAAIVAAVLACAAPALAPPAALAAPAKADHAQEKARREARAEMLEYASELVELFDAADATAEEYHFGLLPSQWLQVGDRLLDRGDVARARRLYQRILDERVFSQAAELNPVARARMARIAALEGRDNDAARLFAAIIPQIEAGGDDDREHLAGVLAEYALALDALGRDTEALAAADRATAVSADAYGGLPYEARARALEGLGRWKDAEGVRSYQLTHTRKYPLGGEAGVTPVSPLYADAEASLAANMAEQGRAGQAEALWESALDVYAKAYPEAHPSALQARIALARARLEGLNAPEQALKDARAVAPLVRAQAAAAPRGSTLQARYRDLFRVQVEAAWAVGHPAPVTAAAKPPAATAVATAPQVAHGSEVVALAFLDDHRFAAAADEGGVVVWDLEAGGATAQLTPAATGPLYDLAATADGQVFLRGVGAVKRWTPGGPLADDATPATSNDGFGVSRDGRWLVTAGRLSGQRGAGIWLRDRATGAERTQTLPTKEVSGLALSPDGRRLAVGQFDFTDDPGDPSRISKLCTYAVPELSLQRCAPLEFVTGRISFSADGAKVLVMDSSSAIEALDAASLAPSSRQETGPLDGGPLMMPGGNRAVVAAEDYSVRLVDLATGGIVQRFDGHGGRVGALAVSADGRYLASGGVDQTARVWDLANGQPFATFGGQVRYERHASDIYRAVFSPDGKRVASAAADGTRIWDAETGVQIERRGGQWIDWSADGRTLLEPAGLTDAATGRLLTPFGDKSLMSEPLFLGDGGVVVNGALGDAQGKAFFYDAKGKVRATTELAAFGKVVPAPAGPLVAILTHGADSRVVDSRTGAAVTPLGAVQGGPPRWAAFSADGATLAVSYMNLLALIDLTQRKVVGAAEVNFISAAAIDGSARKVAVAGAADTQLWPAMDAPPIRLDVTGKVERLAFSPDGKVLAVALKDGVGALFDAGTGARLATLSGHTAELTDILFSPDGGKVLTVSKDRTMRIWRVPDGALAAVLGGAEETR